MISRKSKRIKSFIAMDILELAKQMEKAGEDVISLSIGEPDFPPPESAKKACIQAIEDGVTKYTHSQGLIELREEICIHYKKKYGVKLGFMSLFAKGVLYALKAWPTVNCRLEGNDIVAMEQEASHFIALLETYQGRIV